MFLSQARNGNGSFQGLMILTAQPQIAYMFFEWKMLTLFDEPFLTP